MCGQRWVRFLLCLGFCDTAWCRAGRQSKVVARGSEWLAPVAQDRCQIMPLSVAGTLGSQGVSWTR